MIATAPTRARTAISTRTWIGAIVVLALIVRVALVLGTSDYAPRTDSADYDRSAVSLVQHGTFPSSYLAAKGGPTGFRPPLFPIALAGVYELTGTGSATSRWEAARIFEALLGAVAVLLLSLIALRIWGRRTALIAGAIAAVDPPLILVGSSLLSESLFIPLVLGATLVALVYRDQPRLRWALLSGVLIGLAALTRGNGVFLAIPLAFLVWTARPRLRRRSIAVPLALLVAAALTISPWTIRNEVVFGQFVPISTETGYILAGTYNDAIQYEKDYPALWYLPIAQLRTLYAAHPNYNEAQVSSRLTSEGLSYIGNHPGSLLRTAFWSGMRLLNLTGTTLERLYAFGEAYPLWLTTWSVYAFWVVLALSIAGALTAAARRAPWALWAIPGIVILSTLFFEGMTRYRSPADPFFVLAAALAIATLVGRSR
jgi:4-amino-4-deoxy-L-arabinose transferase-like glycosyltransferase